MKFLLCTVIDDKELAEDNTEVALNSLEQYKYALFNQLHADTKVYPFCCLSDIAFITDNLVKSLGLSNLADSLQLADIADLFNQIK